MRLFSHPVAAGAPVRPRAATWPEALTPALLQVPGTEAAIAALRSPGALVVTTGQQPGLFGGPLYTVHKALAAAALASELTTRWQRPVVPLFWLAGDDHDFSEASNASWLDADGVLQEWHLSPRDPAAPQRSMAREALGVEILSGLRTLEQSLPGSEARDTTLAWLRRHYVPGHTLHAAYAGAIAELLAPWGIVCIDPTSAVFKHAQAPLLARALERASELDAALAALPDAGTGIAAGDGATLVFYENDSGRDRLLVDGDGFRGRRTGVTFTREAMLAELAEHPERCSANVLLRPVVEASLLPTVAYVAGPGEYRYLTQQAAALYPLLDVTPQVPVPRWTGTAVEPWSERLLDRLGLSLEALLDDDGSVGRGILRRDLPDEVPMALAQLRDAISATTVTLSTAGRKIDGVLDRAIASRQRRLSQVADDLERVLERHLRKRGDIAYAQYVRLRTALCPRGAPQERVLSVPSLLARHGTEWLEAVRSAAGTWAAGLGTDPGEG
ncbi:MAG: bacillithiol biosynthesis cysteine-adding enzyme BshC [Gemmatimonadales bacterium]